MTFRLDVLNRRNSTALSSAESLTVGLEHSLMAARRAYTTSRFVMLSYSGRSLGSFSQLHCGDSLCENVVASLAALLVGPVTSPLLSLSRFPPA